MSKINIYSEYSELNKYKNNINNSIEKDNLENSKVI